MTASAVEDPLKKYLEQKPDWNDCDDKGAAGSRCAKIKVPLDYSKPDGKTIEIAVSQVKTSKPGERHGVLLLNPGGPGGSGIKLLKLMTEEKILSDSVGQRFDLIGFDPRGVGQSSPVDCGTTAEEQAWETRSYNPATFDKDVEWARTVAGKCEAKHGDTLRHITTQNAARDMDVIRSVLGEKKISYFGVSYGTYLGAVYTQLFPERADRFVLDSAVDPKRVWRGFFQSRAEDVEAAFTRWTEWTAKRDGTYHLGDTPEKVSKTFWDLVARLDRNPVKRGGQFYDGTFLRETPSSFYDDLGRTAKKIADFKKEAEAASPAPSSDPAPSGDPAEYSADELAALGNESASFWSMTCGDSNTWPTDPEQYRSDAIRDKEKLPLFGDFASHINPCAFWKKPIEPAVTVDSKASALILQNEWDDRTPLSNAIGLKNAMKGSRMVTVTGGVGHGVYDTNSCAEKAANAYLATGQLPDNDLTCQSSDQ